MYKLIITTGIVLISLCSTGQQWNEVLKTVSSDRNNDEGFGSRIDMDGNLAVIGAPGNQFDAGGQNQLGNAGAAFILERDACGSWSVSQKLVASNRSTFDSFGSWVAIDGDWIAVGAQNADAFDGSSTYSGAGSVYMFHRDAATGLWSETEILAPSDVDDADHFGTSLDLEGNVLVVGAPLQDSDVNGSNPLSEAGAAYVFEYQMGTGSWVESQKLTATDRTSNTSFGNSVSIHNGIIALGAHTDGYDLSGANFLLQAGSAYVFTPGVGGWSQAAKLVAPHRHEFDMMGEAVRVQDGKVFVGSPIYSYDAAHSNFMYGSGAVFVFEESSPGNWSLQQQLFASTRSFGDQFGQIFSSENDLLVVGSPYESDDGTGSMVTNAGCVFFFGYDSSTGLWNEDRIFRPQDAQATDFAYVPAVENGTLLLGAPGHDYDQVGANMVGQAGAVYAFEFSPDPCTLDTDNDGVSDCDETNVYGTDPTNCDSDGDGLTDGLEINLAGTSPNLPDTDNDGCTDDLEFHFACPDSVYNDCPHDLDGDGLVSTGDLLSVLANFGMVCP